MNETHVFPNKSWVTSEARAAVVGQRPCTIWLTGLSGAGKSTLAYALEQRLVESKRFCTVLDGDALRTGLCRDLGFGAEHRSENIRRAAEVASLMNDAGLIVITAFISPFARDRQNAADIIGRDRFLEIHVSTSLQECEARDPKGLYKKARAGALKDFTGISSPYEPPAQPHLAIDTGSVGPNEAVNKIMELLDNRVEA